tara:strand:+ start:5700 stop:6185 length:486 start_codon:yes stop_codon:yes gene_type:complete
MKVFILGKLIETKFIKSIQILQDWAGRLSDDDDVCNLIHIEYMFETKPVRIYLDWINSGLKDWDMLIEKQKEEAHEIIRFIDVHSENPSFPFPTYEDPKRWTPIGKTDSAPYDYEKHLDEEAVRWYERIEPGSKMPVDIIKDFARHWHKVILKKSATSPNP